MINLPSGVDINNLIDDIRILSWQVADILLYYTKLLEDSNDKKNILKNNNEDDPVTLADLKVNEMIIKRINEKYKNINWDILSEENVKTSNNFVTKNDWVWVLDPLDGTKDFIQGTGNYAMHLALNFKQKPYIGFVLIPDKNQLWISDGKKTWCEKRNGTKYKPNFSNNKNLQEMTLVTSKNHGNETLRNLIQKINFCKVEIMGSIGCKIASIVRGDSDIYICLSLPGKSSPKDWDFAAPESILKAAGGAITNIDNQELTYGLTSFQQGGIIIATNNRKTHESICLEIKKIIEKNGIYPL
ncbi:3'(2'),5'-bisphosphate nucleotidase CysQ [Prochlorococcus marinus str. XMU1401]|uniref:3'(2'),5'-bisphosphate nucleotidase CysQ n=1 Tax=Prochlorococcus marinus str. XMU1401 TaxID=2052594 RepID=A0A8I1X4D0_PROMR|nr:3'(2'),5'-bisphosphate nucleotidase CysQ [Prochlorococcus marinus]MBO8223256.1 3'(2'),5'-bisphosphate nucleotidase CysQ [Prochlorococcus marinus str. XMU1401]MBW3059787.1 3'(2'),5'-bisphosphate nucleotidase CysQ [Prochlorococcus marinus str. XMU1401E]PJC83603.1 3'(2'),5'-bisphosphate nucleotidase CysQ [Prochlorococcus marinus str. XMU1401]